MPERGEVKNATGLEAEIPFAENITTYGSGTMSLYCREKTPSLPGIFGTRNHTPRLRQSSQAGNRGSPFKLSEHCTCKF